VQEADNIRGERKVFGKLWLVFFLHGMTPGFWMPALTNILKAKGLEDWVALVFVVQPVCALVSPLIGGALADQRIAADRLYAWTSMFGGISLLIAFHCLDAGWNPWWFVTWLGIFSIFSGPAWGLLTTVSMTNLSFGERKFPLVRLGATIGWICGGLITSLLLHADASPISGYASSVTRFGGGLLAFLLPHTPPLGQAKSWKSRLGLEAFTLMRHRDHLVFFLVTALFSVPLTAFYMYAPELLRVLGDQKSTATMTIAQLTEIVAMLIVGSVMMKYRVKTVLSWALGLSVLRFSMSAYAGYSGSINWHIAGIALHGMCYTFYFITAQVFMDRRVDPGLRGQAQGLLALVVSGIGPLVGAVVCGYLRTHLVRDGIHGWMEFWAALAAIIAFCHIAFLLFYRGLHKEPAA